MKRWSFDTFSAMKSSSLLLAFLLSLQTARAGFERRDQGARPIGMSGAFVAVADNVWAIAFNPAGLSRLGGAEISAFYSPQPFGLAELSLASFAYVHPTSRGSFGLLVNRFGFDLYREISAIIAYSNTYEDAFSFGINLTYNSLAIKNYGSASVIGVDVGFLATVTSRLGWGFFAANINAPTIGQAKEKLPQIYSSGLSYSPIKSLIFDVDVVKDVRYPTLIRGGIEYEVVDAANLRVGVGSNPTRFSSGFGVHYSLIHFDYAITTHPDLGLSHQFSVAIDFSDLHSEEPPSKQR